MNTLRIHMPLDSGPGPPPSRLGLPCAYLPLRDDDDDIFSVNGSEPDDLGDLMKEMRDGAAWADGLAMDCEPQLGAAPDANAGSFGGSAAAEAPGVPMPQQAAAACHNIFMYVAQQQQLLEMQQQRQAAAPPLQPGVAALLLHPGANMGAAGGGSMPPGPTSGHMIPVGMPPGELQALAQVPDCGMPDAAPQHQLAAPAGMWAPLPRPPGPYGMAPPPQQQQQHQASVAAPFFSLPLTPSPGPALPSLAFYQAPPASFGAAEQPGQAGSWDPAFMACMVQGAQMPVPMPTQGAPAHFMVDPTEPNASADASAGTTLRARTSFDGDGSGSDSGGTARGGSGGGDCSGTTSRKHHHHYHHAAHHAHGARRPHATRGHGHAPVSSSAAALAAFDEAAAAAAGSGAAGASCTAGAPLGHHHVKSEPGSDSSDAEDSAARSLLRRGSLTREWSLEQGAQVVPDVLGQLPNQHVPATAAAPPFGMLPQPVAVAPPAGFAPLSSLPAGLLAAPHPPAFVSAYYRSPAAQTARVARQASLERYRLKKARRIAGLGCKKIRYQARKINADKRPRVKGRFVKSEEAAALQLPAASAATAVALEQTSGSCAAPSS